jgi:Ca2+-transporting ATPase
MQAGTPLDPEKQTAITGLTMQEVEAIRANSGRNELSARVDRVFWSVVREIATEPMFLLLVVASAIYFVSGATGDGLFMVGALVLVSAISFFQESRSRKAIATLHALTRPRCKVIREGITREIESEELVPGDCMVIDEGTAVPADGRILSAHDFSVNEAMLTGESLAIPKNEQSSDSHVWQGTAVASGWAICEVTQIGNRTKLGQIGQSMEAIKAEKTPLQQQVGNFVKKMAVAGLAIFLVVWLINYFQSQNILESLLKALTLAMSILPEEIPVAFTTFMALGAWRLMQANVIVKQIKTVETLGSATVICTDKTGTITENRMALAQLYLPDIREIVTPDSKMTESGCALIRMAMWSSEPIAYDPMEIALHDAYGALDEEDERLHYRMVHEYPLGGRPPMMTHVFENPSGHRIIACKGASEAIIGLCGLSEEALQAVRQAEKKMASAGFRVLAVGASDFKGLDLPENQQQLSFHFKGLVAFYDPPKENISRVFEAFYEAGIQIKILTGDHAETTATIAAQTGFKNTQNPLDGAEIMRLDEAELRKRVMETGIFYRLFPEAKLRIIHALKAEGQIVAMTGDGVNDGPALKAAHIGIAMGKKGTEIARHAASLILRNDDLSALVEAVGMGRRIYDNLKKAIQYIISIHIPIILTVLAPLALGWVYPSIFTPIHVIFLELIMGPTCSIVFENEPMEANTMKRKPRPFTTTFFHFKELITSIIQGLAIAAGALLAYQFSCSKGLGETGVRTVVFLTLISANVLLTLVNRSFIHALWTTARYRNPLVPLIICLTVFLTGLILFVPFLRDLFRFEWVGMRWIAFSAFIGTASVIWFEIVKAVKRKQI